MKINTFIKRLEADAPEKEFQNLKIEVGFLGGTTVSYAGKDKKIKGKMTLFSFLYNLKHDTFQIKSNKKAFEALEKKRIKILKNKKGLAGVIARFFARFRTSINTKYLFKNYYGHPLPTISPKRPYLEHYNNNSLTYGQQKVIRNRLEATKTYKKTFAYFESLGLNQAQANRFAIEMIENGISLHEFKANVRQAFKIGQKEKKLLNILNLPQDQREAALSKFLKDNFQESEQRVQLNLLLTSLVFHNKIHDFTVTQTMEQRTVVRIKDKNLNEKNTVNPAGNNIDEKNVEIQEKEQEEIQIKKPVIDVRFAKPLSKNLKKAKAAQALKLTNPQLHNSIVYNALNTLYNNMEEQEPNKEYKTLFKTITGKDFSLPKKI